ncbi:hypothetical protein FOMPIDRAFT_1118985, partial [Fomitopsis schrenkii]
TAAVFYEYLLTFIQEVRQYWNRGINIPIALFLANRYFCLIHRLFLLVVVFVRPYPDVRASLVTAYRAVDGDDRY